jgi:hypothetical protein
MCRPSVLPAHTHTHTRTHMHAHTHTHTHTYTHTNANTCKNTCNHAHKYMHTNACSSSFFSPLASRLPRIPTTGSHTKALHINMPGVLWAHVTSVECHWPSHPLFFVLVGKWAPLELGTQGRLLHTRYCKAWLI